MSEPARSFDAVAWMRRKREEQDDEIRRCGWDESRRRMMERLQNDPLWLRLKNRVVEPTSLRSLTLKEGQTPLGTRTPS